MGDCPSFFEKAAFQISPLFLKHIQVLGFPVRSNEVKKDVGMCLFNRFEQSYYG
jgi:hypothetical protein